MRALPPAETMRRAFLRRDPGFDGLFLAAVRSTGIFCRPTCPARRPRAENLEFFGTAEDALASGYRPCLRCRPLEAPGSAPPWVARLLAAMDRAPAERLPDRALRDLGIEPRRARRWFLASYGMTFQAYQRARRLGDAARALGKGGRVLEVAFSHGYESSSGFTSAFRRAIGASPARVGGTEVLTTCSFPTPLGPLSAVATDRALQRLEFREAVAAGPGTVPGTNRVLARLETELRDWFAARRAGFTVPLDPQGTPFQRRVWARLRTIPLGRTASYAEVARAIGSPGAVRAVGQANGANPIVILVPCHRVVRSDGALGGYGGEVWRKEWLLAHERGMRGVASGAVRT